MNYFERFIFGKNISYAEEIIFPSSTYRRCYKQHCTKVCGRSEYEFFCKFLINDGNVSLENLMKNVKYVNDEVRFKMYKIIIDRYKIDEYYDVKDNNEAKKSKCDQNDENEQCKRDENKLDNKDAINNVDNANDVNNIENNDNVNINNIENDIKEISLKKFKEILSKNKKDNKIVKFLEQEEKAEDIFYILKNIIQRYKIIEIHKLNFYSHNEDNKDCKDNNENDNNKEDNKENNNNKDENDNNEIDTKKENVNKNNNQDENDNHDNITDDNHDNTVDMNNDLSINISILIAYIKHFISLPNATTIEVYKLIIILIKKYNFFLNYNKDNKEDRNINDNNKNINNKDKDNNIINRNYLESKLEPRIYKLFTDPQFQLFFYKKLILNKSTADKLIDIIVLMDIISLDRIISDIIDNREIEDIIKNIMNTETESKVNVDNKDNNTDNINNKENNNDFNNSNNENNNDIDSITSNKITDNTKNLFSNKNMKNKLIDVLSSYIIRKILKINTKHFLQYINRKSIMNKIDNNKIYTSIDYFDFLMVQNKMVEEQITLVNSFKDKIAMLEKENGKMKSSVYNLQERNSIFEEELSEYQDHLVSGLKEIIKENKEKIDSLESENIKLKEEIIKNRKNGKV